MHMEITCRSSRLGRVRYQRVIEKIKRPLHNKATNPPPYIQKLLVDRAVEIMFSQLFTFILIFISSKNADYTTRDRDQQPPEHFFSRNVTNPWCTTKREPTNRKHTHVHAFLQFLVRRQTRVSSIPKKERKNVNDR